MLMLPLSIRNLLILILPKVIITILVIALLTVVTIEIIEVKQSYIKVTEMILKVKV